jgi:hypothetical protein
MNWLINDLKDLWTELRRWETWIGIGIISVFGLLAFMIASFASACREMTNGIIVFLFCGMIFFLFSALLTLGEYQQYLEFKKHGARHQARQALIWGAGWGGFGVSLAVAALIFFNSYCR